MSPAVELPVENLVQLYGTQGYAVTIDRVLASIANHEFRLAARIDHAAVAREAGFFLAPTELFIFGNPKGGTPLMAARPTIAIDLPLKLLVQEEPDGRTLISYNDPNSLAQRHGLPSECHQIISGMAESLATIAHEAAVLAQQ